VTTPSAGPGGHARGLVDVHAHHYPDAYLDACRQADSGFEHYIRDDGRLVVLQDGAVALAVPQPLPSMEHRLRLMDEAGVETQVLSVSAPNVFRLPASVRVPLASRLNDELIDLAEASRGRLRLFATLPLPDVDAAMAEVERVRRTSAVVGFVICTTIDRRTLDDSQFAPLWEALSELGAVVFVHPTTGCCTDGVREYALALALDFLAETTNAIGRLVYSGTFTRYSGIRWIFSHLGGTTPFLIHRFDNYFGQFPECRANIDVKPSAILRNVWFDTVSTNVAALRCAFDTFAADQFVFGTDYPHVPGALGVFVDAFETAARASDLDDAAIEGIRSGNARALLGLDNDRPDLI